MFPLSTQAQEGLKVRTTEGERLLSLPYVSQLWQGGKVKDKHFLSFTKTTDLDQKKYGRRTVGKITDGRYTFYVKQYPELPGIEEAVGILTRQLLGYGAPHTLLANIGGTAYLFSEGIEGKPLQDYLTGQADQPWTLVSSHLNPEALSGMILLSMLTNPEDGKPDNYIVQERPDHSYQIIGIDNDHAFVPSASTVQGKRKMNVKSILFALNQMKDPLHPTLKKQFLYHNPLEVLEEWIHQLKERSEEYESLFTQKEIVKHFSDYESFLGFALHPTIVVEIYKNLSALQQLIESEETLTHMDLLRKFHRPIYLRYQAGHEAISEDNPLERFKTVDGKEYKISKKKGLETLSTGKNLLSTNMMITTKKDLFEYVKRGRGREIRLDDALETLKEIAEQDSHILVQQAITQTGATIPFERMTDPQRESFLKELDWSKLSIATQQALLKEIARVSWGNPKENLSPWRGKLTFKNCSGFTEGNIITKGFAEGMNWENIHEIHLLVDEKGGRDVLLNAGNVLSKTTVPLKTQIENIEITDEELDDLMEKTKQLIFKNCRGLEDPELRQKMPTLKWKEILNLPREGRNRVKDVLLKNVKELDLTGIKIADEGAKLLIKMLKDTQVCVLSLKSNEIGSIGAEALAAGLRGKRIKELNLADNNIAATGIGALAKMLKDIQVQKLNLAGNRVGKAGSMILAENGLGSLRELNLADNGVGVVGAMHLAEALGGSQIRVLDLTGNHIGDQGALALASAFGWKLRYKKCGMLDEETEEWARKKDVRVRKLYLGRNDISDQGAQSLIEALKNTQVKELRFFSNDNGYRAKKVALEKELKRNQEMEKGPVRIIGAVEHTLKAIEVWKLSLKDNKISDTVLKQMEEILAENRARLGVSGEEDENTDPDEENERNSIFLKKPQSQTSATSLESLLLAVGMKGGDSQHSYVNDLERAENLLLQKKEVAYPRILCMLTRVFNQDKSKILELKDDIGEEEFGFGADSETDIDTFEEEKNREKSLELLQQLRKVYPRALLSLAEVYQEEGDTNQVVEALHQSLQYQLPGTEEKIKNIFVADGNPLYALLLAENALHGFCGRTPKSVSPELGRFPEMLL